jgi:hypothetical protein
MIVWGSSRRMICGTMNVTNELRNFLHDIYLVILLYPLSGVHPRHMYRIRFRSIAFNVQLFCPFHFSVQAQLTPRRLQLTKEHVLKQPLFQLHLY